MGLGKTIQAMAFLAHLAEEKKYMGTFFGCCTYFCIK
ncbi:hypothetical protein GLYMA_07G132450v4 [Glycine max]|nr:hypothetical protein GLYMA_07G132450v4 [Glycine max]KAH1086697.1 hypothetical protein GYH30_018274 [Glycine max]